METKHTNLRAHITTINAALRDVCGFGQTGPLVTEQVDQGRLIINTSDAGFLSKLVLTDLGSRETALPLPVPYRSKPRFWVALHENWEFVSKRKIRFMDCGLRIYFGEQDGNPSQVFRLEWVAPVLGPDGMQSYSGKHAGHPHWHIDRTALVGPEDYLHRLEALTTPESHPLEDFSSSVVNETVRLPLDCSWLQNIHLPAQARWMDFAWDGREIPGPHQTEPSDLEHLGRWWTGALKYIVIELSRS